MSEDYRLEAQVGFLLRLATQRHVAIFQRIAPEALTPRQFSTLVRLGEAGPTSQNALGRLVSMDAATTKGVVGRLRDRGLVELAPDPADRRRALVSLSRAGRALLPRLREAGERITAETLAPLEPEERERLARLLARVG